MIEYTLSKNIFHIHHSIYYPLPLFEFFHIPDPLSMKMMAERLLNLSLSLSALFFVLKIILLISLVLSLTGFFQRFFIFLSFMAFFLFQGWLYGYIRTENDPYVYHSANIVCFIFCVWLFAPPCPRWTVFFWIKRLSLFIPLRFYGMKNTEKLKPNHHYKTTQQETRKQYPVWPRLLVILTIAITFFSSFYCKLDTAGWEWINGYTLQGRLLESYAIHHVPEAYWLAQQNFYLIWFFNIGVWLFQSTAPIGYLLKRTRLIYAVIGTVFHIFIIVFFGFPFIPFQYIYVVFIPEIVQFVSAFHKNIPVRFERLWKKLKKSP